MEKKEKIKLKDDESGLAITDVAAGSAAEMAGLQAGDEILAAGGKHPGNAEQFGELAKNASSEKGLLLRVKRGETTRFFVVKPEK